MGRLKKIAETATKDIAAFFALFILIAGLAVFTGCIGPEQPTGMMGIRPVSADADGDGYQAGKKADCDDSNPNINPGVIENTRALCTDGIDNDCDRKIDERDADCKKILNAETEAGACGDGIDNDYDGYVDCVDSDCSDGMDNDCDGYKDCYDWDCDLDPACKIPVDLVCGDGKCEGSEDWQNCPADCTANPNPSPAVSGRLEIHHIDIGQGDATILVSPSGKVVLFDAGESYWNSGKDAQRISTYIQVLTGGKHIDYFINSHMHLDHIGYGGIWKLVNGYGFTVGKSYVRDYNEVLGTYSGTYGKFVNWTTLDRGDAQLNLELVNSSKTPFTIDLGDGVTIDVVLVNAEGIIAPRDYSRDASPPSENDFSMVTVVRYGNFDELIAGDLSGVNYDTGSTTTEAVIQQMRHS
jgi:hypothetical protein